MKYTRKELLQLPNHHLELSEDIEFTEETYKQFPRIRKLRDVHADVRGEYAADEQRLYLQIHVTGIMTCPCDITFEDVDIPFDSTAAETVGFSKEDQENIEILKPDGEVVELLPIIFRQILVEVPIKVRKEGLIEYPRGEGWSVMTEEQYRKEREGQIDPRLAALKDYIPQDE